jgi:hypothetical protein
MQLESVSDAIRELEITRDEAERGFSVARLRERRAITSIERAA